MLGKYRQPFSLGVREEEIMVSDGNIFLDPSVSSYIILLSIQREFTVAQK
jgi:hypothetical protein